MIEKINLFQKICKIYNTKQINSKIIKDLSLNKDNNHIMKKYLLEFLIDKTDNMINFNKIEDFWFIKEKPQNQNIIKKYVNLMVNIIENNKIISGIDFCNNFFDTYIEKKNNFDLFNP